MKVLQIKVGGRKLFGRSLKLRANVQCSTVRQGSEVCCKAGVFCYAIDLDFRLTESWGESKELIVKNLL